MANCSAILLQTFNFCVTLVVNSDDVNRPRMPQKLKLHSNPDFAGTVEDPIKYLLLKNIVTSPAMMPNGEPWRGAKEKFDIFFQLLIDVCSKFGDTVVDLTTSTGASLRACRASGLHFIGAK